MFADERERLGGIPVFRVGDVMPFIVIRRANLPAPALTLGPTPATLPPFPFHPCHPSRAN
jgi:hypothetical protein